MIIERELGRSPMPTGLGTEIGMSSRKGDEEADREDEYRCEAGCVEIGRIVFIGCPIFAIRI